MKAFTNYDDAKKQAQATGSAKLPAGAYVCKIMGVRYEEGTDGFSDKLILQFDITEGDQKDFFKKQYEANTAEDKKWKGTVRVYVPTDDGSERDGWTKRSFAGWIDAVEKSNPGYSWSWDEQTLKNKLIGIVFGETGTVINGKNIIYTEARFGVDIEKVRTGSAPAAKFKVKNGYTNEPAKKVLDDDFMKVSDSAESEIPF